MCAELSYLEMADAAADAAYAAYTAARTVGDAERELAAYYAACRRCDVAATEEKARRNYAIVAAGGKLPVGEYYVSTAQFTGLMDKEFDMFELHLIVRRLLAAGEIFPGSEQRVFDSKNRGFTLRGDRFTKLVLWEMLEHLPYDTYNGQCGLAEYRGFKKAIGLRPGGYSAQYRALDIEVM